MAKADEEGIPFEDYIKVKPEPLVRTKLDRGELRYTWVDADGNARASDDGGPQPPKGWWGMVETTKFDRERRSVRGLAYLEPSFPEMFFVRVYPVPAVEQQAQEAPRRGRPSSAPLVLEEAERRLQGSDRAEYIKRGRDNFLAGLSDWLLITHPNVRPMAAKTIGDHLRENANVQALLPESWLRRT
jgi:hypothetical protein